MIPAIKQLATLLDRELPDYFAQRRASWQPDIAMDRSFKALPLPMILIGLIVYLVSGMQAGFFTLQGYGAAILPVFVWENITFLGDTMVALAILLLFSFRFPHLVLAIIVAAVVGTLLTHGLKGVLSTLRPPGILSAGDFILIGPGFKNDSLPSGHTVTAFITAVLLTRTVQLSFYKWCIIAMAGLIGVSRVICGVHWPLDVVLGAAIGVFSGWVGLRASDVMRLTLSRYLVLCGILLLNAMLLLFEDGGFDSTGITATVLALSALAYWSLNWLVYLMAVNSRPGVGSRFAVGPPFKSNLQQQSNEAS